MMTCPTFQIASIKDNRSYNFYSRPVRGGSGRRNLDRITDEVPSVPAGGGGVDEVEGLRSGSAWPVAWLLKISVT